MPACLPAQALHLKEMDWASLGGKVRPVELSLNYRDWYGDLTQRAQHGGSNGAALEPACSGGATRAVA